MTNSLEIVVPVLNEEQSLASSIGVLHKFLSRHFNDYKWRLLIADNGSTDATPKIANLLTSKHVDVFYMRLEQPGRGLALRRAWLESEADVVCYMDVDLSTNLEALPGLIETIVSGGYDMALGSRLTSGSKVIGRPFLREILSRGYNLIIRRLFRTNFTDAQCGFKALSCRAAQELVPLVQDESWFFDTELLILADKNGYRVKDIPVQWIDDQDSRVRIVGTVYDDMKGLLRMRLGGLHWASTRIEAHVRDCKPN